MILCLLIGLALVSLSTEGKRIKFGLYLTGLLVMSCYVITWDHDRLIIHWIPALIDALVLIGMGMWMGERIFAPRPMPSREEWEKAFKAIDDLTKATEKCADDHSKHTD